MSALQRVQAALKDDQQRVQQRQCEADVLDKHFRQTVAKIITVNRSLKAGIRRSTLRDQKDALKFRPAMDEEHKRLQSKVLSNRHLMAQSSRSIRSIHEFILEACDDTLESLDQAGLLERVAKALHEAKLHTAHLCWHEIVEPLRAHQKRLQAGQEAMRSQLTQLRTAYLKEVSELRDLARPGRHGPHELDRVCYFYEPLNSLEPPEREFMINLTREVLKMMMDSDGSMHFAQIQRIVSQEHEKEVSHLQQEIEKREEKIRELGEAHRSMEMQISRHKPKNELDLAEQLEKLLAVAQEQLSNVRHDYYRLQQEEQRLREELRSSECERAELAKQIEQEMAEGVILQSEVTRLCSVEEEQKSVLRLLAKERDELKDLVQEQQTRYGSLQKSVQRRISREIQPMEFSDDAYAALQQDMQRASQVQREGTEDQLDDTDESEAEAGKESQKAMELPDAALEAAKKENEHLRARCDQLEGLLREHAIQLTTLPMQQDQEAALPLLRQAEALDCALLTSPKMRAAQALDCAESPKRALLTQVRVCNCGNILMEDALFCRKCGGRWRGTEAKAELAGDITELQDQILQAEKVLRDSVEPKLPVAAERMSTASFILRPNGGWTDTGSNEDEMELEQSIKLMQLRKNVEELKSQKLQAEARLLTQRCGDLATAEVMDLTPSETDEEIFGSERPETVPLYGCDGVNCEYRRRLKAQGALIAALRGLCSQLGEKLQEATGEHLEMSLALSAMQGSLEGAVEAVESCKKQPKEDLNRTLTQLSASLQESKRRSVFWRLYQNSSRRRRPGADKRLELLKKTYEHLYKIDAVSGRDANPQSPSRTPSKKLPASMAEKRAVLPVIAKPPCKASSPRNSTSATPRNSIQVVNLVVQGAEIPIPTSAPPVSVPSKSKRRIAR
ncbi:unnamed protein product [Effrenium voratum]|uniref:Uncharacterized protein n=1 Tax=Effrenium voratum TaxID=2562239 RepID=A0AA36I6A3_9DINO|nr:unnamed protein product [Effrenium voratum]